MMKNNHRTIVVILVGDLHLDLRVKDKLMILYLLLRKKTVIQDVVLETLLILRFH